jgi:FkbM family methyltransferase
MIQWLRDLVFLVVPKWRFMNTYSQAGEDVMAAYFFFKHHIQHPSYLDIGTNDPISGNNTFLFYKRGSKGVCIEADPTLIPALKKARPKDHIITAGVTFDNRSEADFYVFELASHNTLSKEEADFRVSKGGQKLKEVIRIPLVNINTLIETHFPKGVDFLSLDVEGIDLMILESLNFEKHRPALICVESITFSMDNQETRISEIASFMKAKGYRVYADSPINTLFADNRFYAQAT